MCYPLSSPIMPSAHFAIYRVHCFAVHAGLLMEVSCIQQLRHCRCLHPAHHAALPCPALPCPALPCPASSCLKCGQNVKLTSAVLKVTCTLPFVRKPVCVVVCSGSCSNFLTASPALGFRQHEGVTSAILVGSQVIRHAAAAAQGKLWAPFVAAAWPWTMWHNHAIRSPPFTPHAARSMLPAMHIRTMRSVNVMVTSDEYLACWFWVHHCKFLRRHKRSVLE